VVLATALAAGFAPVNGQQADFGSELYARDPWMVRLDASTDPASTVIDASGTGIRVTTRAGAILWRPADRMAGAFTVRATVRLAEGTPGGAGLFFGGFDLEGIDRNYATCLVRADGQWSIAHRNGVELHDFRSWVRADVVLPVAAGGATNVVEWVVAADRVACRINGVEMYGFPRGKSIVVRGGLRTIDGDVGLRVDANSAATFYGFTVAALPALAGRP
jgi:hypothetical protein